MRLAAQCEEVAGVVLIDSAGAKPRRGIKYHLKVTLYKLGKKLGCKRLPKGSADYEALSGAMKGTFVNVVNEDSECDAAAIRVPTLVIWGSEDKDTPLYMCRRLHSLIKDSEVILLKGAGHFSYLERSEHCSRIIRVFGGSV